MRTKKIIWALTVVASLAMIALAQQQRETSIELDGGHVAILNPDSTWTYRQPPLVEPKNDIFILMKNNQYLWLKVSNYTYTYTRTIPKVKQRLEIPANLPSLNVVGVGQNHDLDRSTRAASDDAYAKATTQLRKVLPAKLPANAPAYLTACIKDQIKEHDIETNYSQSKQQGWKTEAKITANPHRVRKIMECLELQLEPDPK